MGITERLPIVMTNTEPLNKHVIWLKGNVFRRWDGDGWEIIGGGGSGTTNYNDLENKPSINGKPLIGNLNIELGDSQVDLSNYYTKQDIDNKKFLTEHQSLEGYATKEWVAEQGFIIEIPNIDLTNYATQQFVLDEIAKAQLSGGNVDVSLLDNIYVIDLNSFSTPEDYNNLLNAINTNKLITFNLGGLVPAVISALEDNSIVLHITTITSDGPEGDLGLVELIITINSDGTFEINQSGITLKKDGNGDTFLNDKGEYVTIESGESYDLATQTSDGLMSKEDKIKLDGLGDASGIILTQAQYDALETYDNVVYFIKG